MMLHRVSCTFIAVSVRQFSSFPTLYPKKLPDIIDIAKISKEYPLDNPSDYDTNIKAIKNM